MCGIVGIVNVNGEPVSERQLGSMTNRLAHRGPDDRGLYTEGPVGLGHRRLAVIDLSPTAHQPMLSTCGRFVVAYNGEIYNFRDLRDELERKGYWFRSQSDTEVLLNAYVEWREDCLSRLNGMFAFAIWDRQRRRLILARDRYGVKPLYWYEKGGLFLAASEIKAILEHPRVTRDVNGPALNEYFTFQNIFSDATLFEGIRLLPPGCILTLDLQGRGGAAQRRYWDYEFTGALSHLSDEEASDRLCDLFSRAVTRQLVSDVTVGSYLSGGIDSSSITAVAAKRLPRLTTFTGGFDLTSASGLELGFDERPVAEVLANQFKTEHYEVVLHAGDMEAVMPALIWHMEDLRVGQSYPNYYVARLASKFLKVVLSGTGGDELFGGYPWRYYRGLPSRSREDYFRRYYEFWQRLVRDEEKERLFTPGVRRQIGDHSTYETFRDVFASWSGAFAEPDDYFHASLYFELKTFLHGLLVVEDKLSMAHSLETRLPFLDNDLVDFALALPARYKLGGASPAVRVDENRPAKRRLYDLETSNGKPLLRRTMRRLIPEDVTRRAKQGFSAPDASWFRGESIDYINRLLRNPHALIYEFLTPASVAGVLEDHCSGRVNRRLMIWSLLSFEWWCRTFLLSNGRPDSASEKAADTVVVGG